MYKASHSPAFNAKGQERISSTIKMRSRSTVGHRASNDGVTLLLFIVSHHYYLLKRHSFYCKKTNWKNVVNLWWKIVNWNTLTA